VQNVVAQGDRLRQILQAQGVPGHRFQAEVVRHAAGGDDQVVIGDGVGLPAGADDHPPAGRVDRLHLAHHRAHVRRVAEDGAHGVGDLAGVQAGRRHLVKQRREGVVVLAVDHDHIDLAVCQRPGGEQAAEAGADDHHLRAGAGRHRALLSGLARLPNSSRNWTIYVNFITICPGKGLEDGERKGQEGAGRRLRASAGAGHSAEARASCTRVWIASCRAALVARMGGKRARHSLPSGSDSRPPASWISRLPAALSQGLSVRWM